MPADLLSPDAHALAVHLHDRLMPAWEALALPARWTPADLPADLAPPLDHRLPHREAETAKAHRG